MTPLSQPTVSQPRSSQPSRRVGTALIGLFSVFALILAMGSGMARAESFTYWSLWVTEDGKWVAAQKSAAELQLEDQSVFAAKYLTSEVELTAADAPKDTPDYEALCPGSKAEEGQARVAVVLDYGDASLAPSGQTPPANTVACVAVPVPATAASALGTAASVTQDSSGFITEIDGYPRTGGGSESSASPVPVNTDDSTPIGWIIGVVALVVIAILIGLAMTRRKSSQAGQSGGDAGA